MSTLSMILAAHLALPLTSWKVSNGHSLCALNLPSNLLYVTFILSPFFSRILPGCFSHSVSISAHLLSASDSPHFANIFGPVPLACAPIISSQLCMFVDLNSLCSFEEETPLVYFCRTAKLPCLLQVPCHRMYVCTRLG